MNQSGPSVALVQAKINALGYSPPLVVDGKWGPKTAAAVSWARVRFGLPPGGIDASLVAKLGAVPSPAGPSPSSVSSPEFAPLAAFAAKYGQKVTQASGVAPGFVATRASVVASFVDWSSPFEGYIDYPYTDAEGLVTTGMGNLIDSLAAGQQMHVNCGHGTKVPCGQASPTAAARALPWSGSIDADWSKIKAAWPGIQSTACKGITSARLSRDAVVSLVTARLKANDAVLSKLPGFAQTPADGQLAMHSMSWAMGTGGLARFTSFLAAIASGDYAAAAAQSHMQGVGIDMRNLANKLLLLNSAAVKASGLNPDHLYYLDMARAATLPLAGPLAIARGLSKFDALDFGIVLGCTILGASFGFLGAAVGFVAGAGIDFWRRAKR